MHLFILSMTALADPPATNQDFGPTAVYERPRSTVHDKPLVIETACGTWVLDTLNFEEQFISKAGGGAGGPIDPVHEANLMRQLRENWPGENGRAIESPYTTSTGWRIGQGGNRVCTWKKDAEVLCFEPRANLFVEVYVGRACGASDYTREEALVILAGALGLDPDWQPPHRPLEFAPDWPPPKVFEEDRP